MLMYGTGWRELPKDTPASPNSLAATKPWTLVPEPTSVQREWASNAFIRVWRGLDAEGSKRCTALGMPATLVLLGEDYDGGTKAWVRWEDGSDDIVPGSQVQQSS